MIYIKSKTNTVKAVGSTAILTYDLELAVRAVYEAFLEENYSEEYIKEYLLGVINTGLSYEENKGSVLKEEMEATGKAILKSIKVMLDKNDNEMEEVADEHDDADGALN